MSRLSVLLPILAMLSGCAVSPSIPILGAYFPGWLLCATGALFATLIIRAVLVKLDRADRMGPPIVVYSLMTLIGTFLLWILFFRN